MYALADCNNFFVSCERVFNPGLNDRLLLCFLTTTDALYRAATRQKPWALPWEFPYIR